MTRDPFETLRENPFEVPLPPAPQPEIARPGRAVGIAAIVCGALGMLFLPVVFGPIALVLGIVAVAQHYRLAWIAIGLASIEVFIVAKAFYDLSVALESF